MFSVRVIETPFLLLPTSTSPRSTHVCVFACGNALGTLTRVKTGLSKILTNKILINNLVDVLKRREKNTQHNVLFLKKFDDILRTKVF